MADESNSLRVRLVTPERILFETTADAIELPAKNGYMEVLYGHAPLLAELLPDRVTILANDALKPEEIDVPRAQKQLERGEKEWLEAGDSEEKYDEALHRIEEATAKLATAQEK
jgi:F-type H+-transporting ATPase subunit epsilon